MLTQYIDAAMEQARYELLEDGSYYGEVEALPGVWADGPTLEECRRTLKEVIEDWLVLMLKAGDPVPVLAGINLNKVGERVGLMPHPTSRRELVREPIARRLMPGRSCPVV